MDENPYRSPREVEHRSPKPSSRSFRPLYGSWTITAFVILFTLLAVFILTQWLVF